MSTWQIEVDTWNWNCQVMCQIDPQSHYLLNCDKKYFNLNRSHMDDKFVRIIMHVKFRPENSLETHTWNYLKRQASQAKDSPIYQWNNLLPFGHHTVYGWWFCMSCQCVSAMQAAISRLLILLSCLAGRRTDRPGWRHLQLLSLSVFTTARHQLTRCRLHPS